MLNRYGVPMVSHSGVACQRRHNAIWFQCGLPRSFAGKKYALACDEVGIGDLSSACCRWDAKTKAVIRWMRRKDENYLRCRICRGEIHGAESIWYDSGMVAVVFGRRIEHVCDPCQRRMYISLCHRITGWARDEGLIERWQGARDVVSSDLWLARYMTGLAAIATLATQVAEAARAQKERRHTTSSASPAISTQGLDISKPLAQETG